MIRILSILLLIMLPDAVFSRDCSTDLNELLREMHRLDSRNFNNSPYLPSVRRVLRHKVERIAQDPKSIENLLFEFGRAPAMGKSFILESLGKIYGASPPATKLRIEAFVLQQMDRYPFLDHNIHDTFFLTLGRVGETLPSSDPLYQNITSFLMAELDSGLGVYETMAAFSALSDMHFAPVIDHLLEAIFMGGRLQRRAKWSLMSFDGEAQEAVELVLFEPPRDQHRLNITGVVLQEVASASISWLTHLTYIPVSPVLALSSRLLHERPEISFIRVLKNLFLESREALSSRLMTLEIVSKTHAARSVRREAFKALRTLEDYEIRRTQGYSPRGGFDRGAPHASPVFFSDFINY